MLGPCRLKGERAWSAVDRGGEAVQRSLVLDVGNHWFWTRLSHRGEVWSWRTWRQLRPWRPDRWTKLLRKGRKPSSKTLKRQCRPCGALRARHVYTFLERGELKTEIDELFDCSNSAVFFGHYITKLFSFRSVSRVATKYTSIFTDEGEIYPRHGRDIIVRYFLVPIPQICPINTYVRDKYFGYALRILQIRNDGTCLKICEVDLWNVYDILYMLSCAMALKNLFILNAQSICYSLTSDQFGGWFFLH